MCARCLARPPFCSLAPHTHSPWVERRSDHRSAKRLPPRPHRRDGRVSSAAPRGEGRRGGPAELPRRLRQSGRGGGRQGWPEGGNSLRGPATRRAAARLMGRPKGPAPSARCARGRAAFPESPLCPSHTLCMSPRSLRTWDHVLTCQLTGQYLRHYTASSALVRLDRRLECTRASPHAASDTIALFIMRDN